jgi:putative nucleotidyltransferase with HDIG domain
MASINKSDWNILIVDDDSSVRDILIQKLSIDGYNCKDADCAESALDLFQENYHPDVVITDVKMPGMDGIDLLRMIKKLEEEIGVVIITAYADIESVITALEAGANDYIIKPFFNLDEISICVSRALEWRKLKLENREYQLNLEKKITAQSERIRDLFMNSIKALSQALEAKDIYTIGHSRRVSEISGAITERLGLNGKMREQIMLAGLLHDIGKIGIADSILHKKGSLNYQEYAIVKQHPVVGEAIISQIEPPQYIREGIRQHHERWDGKGYPDGLAGEEISMVGRILAVADVYDALTSIRPYREAFSHEKALEELVRVADSQLDREIVTTFLSLQESWSDKEEQKANDQLVPFW